MPPDPRHPGRESTLSLEPGVLDEALARDRAASGPPPDAHPTQPPTGDDQMTPPTPDVSKPTAAEMARSGLTRVPTDHYHLGAFRYNTLAEALAQARRQAGAAGNAGAGRAEEHIFELQSPMRKPYAVFSLKKK